MENEVNSTVEQENTTPEVDTTENQDNASEIEKLKAELEAAQEAAKAEKAARAKDKAALDKALKDVARMTKESREKMTDAEREAARRQEEWDALVEKNTELEKYRQTQLAKERYMLRGMPVDLASKAAEAEVAGNMEELSNIEQQYHDAEMKAAEAEWKKSRPRVNTGDGSTPMTKEEIFAIDDPVKRREAIARNIDQF